MSGQQPEREMKNETLDGTRELLNLREQVKSLSPPEQLRLAAGLIEHGKLSLAETIAGSVVERVLDAHKFGVRAICQVCQMVKAPVGRSVAPEMALGMCDLECEGYRQLPFVGSLWPNESEEQFGYPVGSVGVRWIPEEAEPEQPERGEG